MPDCSAQRGRAVFELIDRPGRLAGVRLVQEIGLAGPLEFARTRGSWRLEVDLPDVRRMEYLFEIRDRHGARMTVLDPANPRRAAGAFGEKSVLELAGYAPPAWLARTPIEGVHSSSQLAAPDLDGGVDLTLWAPLDLAPELPAPLLVVHDGPEYARLGSFVQYLAASIATGELPPLRAALLDPGNRNAWYSANPGYAQTLTDVVLPALDATVATTVRIGVGASLGALAMLHVHRSYPDRLDGLLLQSGSFFTPELDPQESSFSGFATVTEFVAETHGTRADGRAVPAVLTCGTVEENLANNRLMAATLHRLGYPGHIVTVPDAHNYTAWRDALDPHLTVLVSDVVGARAT
ncbi:MAG TPA: alpha/beta hydrolase-fold protein [Jatrophihabitans sp.]|nr:alpha/beta hydrolase-fold protein [Jatrophihabitans sp.]